MRWFIQFDRSSGFITGAVQSAEAPTALPDGIGQIEHDSSEFLGMRVNPESLQLEPQEAPGE